MLAPCSSSNRQDSKCPWDIAHISGVLELDIFQQKLFWANLWNQPAIYLNHSTHWGFPLVKCIYIAQLLRSLGYKYKAEISYMCCSVPSILQPFILSCILVTKTPWIVPKCRLCAHCNLCLKITCRYFQGHVDRYKTKGTLYFMISTLYLPRCLILL